MFMSSHFGKTWFSNSFIDSPGQSGSGLKRKFFDRAWCRIYLDNQRPRNLERDTMLAFYRFGVGVTK